MHKSLCGASLISIGWGPPLPVDWKGKIGPMATPVSLYGLAGSWWCIAHWPVIFINWRRLYLNIHGLYFGQLQLWKVCELRILCHAQDSFKIHICFIPINDKSRCLVKGLHSVFVSFTAVKSGWYHKNWTAEICIVGMQSTLWGWTLFTMYTRDSKKCFFCQFSEQECQQVLIIDPLRFKLFLIAEISSSANGYFSVNIYMGGVGVLCYSAILTFSNPAALLLLQRQYICWEEQRSVASYAEVVSS